MKLNFDSKRNMFGSAVFIFGFLLAACSKPAAKEVVTADGGIESIDPNQKAAPKNETQDAGSKPVTDVTLDGKGDQIAEGSAAASVPPTPTIDTLAGSGDGSGAGPAAAEINKVEAIPEPSTEVPAAEDTLAENKEFIGSGPQTRFIKAWELNIRSQPNRFSKIVGHLKGGDEVHVSLHGGWAKLDNGKWIRSRWLVKSAPSKFVGGPDDESAVNPKAKIRHHKKKNKKTKTRQK